jgi:hypothetical protein
LKSVSSSSSTWNWTLTGQNIFATLGLHENLAIETSKCNRVSASKFITSFTGGESRMKTNRIAAAVLGAQILIGMAAVPALAAGKSETLTGEVSDAMCGAKHEMPGKAADCTRGCVKHGSKYALVVGDKVYTLETTDKATLDKLDELAGTKAKVTGEVDGATVAVKSVAAGS